MKFRLRTSRGRRVVAVVVVGVFGASACAGSDGDSTGPTGEPAVTEVARADASTPATEPAATEPAATEASSVTDPAAPAASGPLKPWTVMLYSIADTDLEPFMMNDVAEFGEVGTTDAVNLVALVDRAADYSSDPVLGLPDWQGAKLLEIGSGTATVLSEPGDLNTGDPAVLAEFVASMMQAYPAEHYALVVSDHGASWPGVGGDESAGSDGLSLPELHAAIADGLARGGADQLDLLGFDACLMATYEVASNLAPLARRLVASQELEPGHGWDYRSFGVLAGGEPVEVDTLGNAILDGYRDQARAEQTDADITLSLIDLEQIGALDTAVAEFTTAVAERAAVYGPALGGIREQTLAYGRSPDSEEDTQMVDLGDLISRIGVEALDLSDGADSVIRALNDTVLRTVEGAASIRSTGLSVYFPPTAATFDADYREVVGESPWLSLLDGYYGAGDAIPTEDEPEFAPADSGDTAAVEVGPDGITISAAVNADALPNLVRTVISYGIVHEDGSITFLGEETQPFENDGSGIVSGTFDLTTFTMSDGEDTYTGYLWLDVDAEAGVLTFDIPMAYYAPDDVEGETYQDALLSITVDAETFDILQETYYAYDEAAETYGELYAEPEGIIVPEVFVQAPDGTGTWEPTSDTGLYADLESLTYDFVRLDSGTQLYIDIAVVDYGGNSALASAEVAVP